MHASIPLGNGLHEQKKNAHRSRIMWNGKTYKIVIRALEQPTPIIFCQHSNVYIYSYFWISFPCPELLKCS